MDAEVDPALPTVATQQSSEPVPIPEVKVRQDVLELERQQKERFLAEKLERRANLLAGSTRKFVGEFQAASRPVAKNVSAVAAGKAGKGAKGKPAKPPPSKGKDGKAKVVRTPKAEAWAVFLADLDEKVNKSKKCGLEDFYRAVGRLDQYEQQMLSSILASTTKKELPTATMTDPVLAIKETLFAAAAAYSYTSPKMPDASSKPAQVFRECGVSARQALDAGFRVGQLHRAGYSTRELVEGCHSISELRQGGISVADVISAGMHNLEGLSGAQQLKAAGYTAVAIQEDAAGAIGAWDLRLAGYGKHGTHSTAHSGMGNTTLAGSTFSSISSSRNVRVPPLLPLQPQRSSVHLSQKLQLQHMTHGTSSSGVAELMTELQHTAPGLGIMQASGAMEYFRHGLKPVMHMAEQDMPITVLGTRKRDHETAVPIAEHSTRHRSRAGGGLRRSIDEGESSYSSVPDSPSKRRGRGLTTAGMAHAAGGPKEVATGGVLLSAAPHAGLHRAGMVQHPSRFVSDSMASTHDDDEC